MLAAFILAVVTSCNKENLGENSGVLEGTQTTTITVAVPNGAGTKSVDPMTNNSDPVKFDIDQPVTFNVYQDQFESSPSSVITAVLEKEDDSSTSEYTEYTATLSLPSGSKYIDVILNGDNASRTNNVNTRQGGQDVAAVRISRSDNNTGQITAVTGTVGIDAKATVTVSPEMARLEMINDMTTSNGGFDGTETAGQVTIITKDEATGALISTNKNTLTKTQALTHYKGLTFTSYYIDNIHLLRENSVAEPPFVDDSNKSGASGEYDRNAWLADYSGVNVKKEFMHDAKIKYTANSAWGVIMGDTESALPSSFLPSFFAEKASGTIETSVGYNVFDQNAYIISSGAPTNHDEAKLVQPHFIIEISYFPALTWDSNGEALTWSTTKITRYMNFGAFRAASGAGYAETYATFSKGYVYQFKLSDVLDALTNLDKTTTETGGGTRPPGGGEDPDADDVDVALEVKVLDWKVVAVTPEPL